MRAHRMKYITMTYINKTSSKYGPLGLYYLASFLRTPKPRWFILLTTFLVFVTIFHHLHKFPYRNFNRLFSSDDEYDSIMGDGMSENNEGEDPATTTPAAGIEVVIDITQREPNFKLATKSGDKPSTDGNRGYHRVLDELHLQETCQQDPSTTVVDIGAGLGEFGLYAAACGCTVYMFELQPEKVTLIRSSVTHNSFTSPPVIIFQNAVSDLPSDSVMTYTPPEGTDDSAVSAQTMRLDEISWSTASIYALKVDTAGSELSVLRSAKSLFAQKRIKHLFFDFSPWLGEEESQRSLLSYVRRDLKPKFMYSLYRTDPRMFGPVVPLHFQAISARATQSRTATIIYAAFDNKLIKSSIQSEPFQSGQR